MTYSVVDAILFLAGKSRARNANQELSMTNWKGVIANSNLIEAESATSYLVKLPKTDFKFWHSKKLIRLSGKGNYRMDIRYPEDFIFKCKRYGTKNNVLEEKELSPAEFEKHFGTDDESQG